MSGPLPAAFYCCPIICNCLCTLVGAVDGDDIDLTWTTTGVDTGTVKIVDSLGNETSVADDGTTTIIDGKCRKYWLTYECDGVAAVIACEYENTDTIAAAAVCQCVEPGTNYMSAKKGILVTVDGTPTVSPYTTGCGGGPNTHGCHDFSGSYLVGCGGVSVYAETYLRKVCQLGTGNWRRTTQWICVTEGINSANVKMGWGPQTQSVSEPALEQDVTVPGSCSGGSGIYQREVVVGSTTSTVTKCGINFEVCPSGALSVSSDTELNTSGAGCRYTGTISASWV